MTTDERTKKWRRKRVEERLEELSSPAQGLMPGVLWSMAELRVIERQRQKPEFRKRVDAEYERLRKEAEQALVIEYEYCSPT